MKPKILLFDIENSPLITYAWGIHEDPSHSTKFVKEDWYIMCWAAKWLGENKVLSSSLIDFNYNKNKPDDKQVLKKLWSLLDESDIVIAHNGKKFDIRKANARFMQNNINPPSPYLVIDTLTESRKSFAFTSHKLGDLGNYLGVGSKMETGGFDLWKNCMEGDMASWKTMIEYCQQDVLLLEKVYLKLRPYMKTHPNVSTDSEEFLQCKRCSSYNMIKKGLFEFKNHTNQRYKCKECSKAIDILISGIKKKKLKEYLCPRCGEMKLVENTKRFNVGSIAQIFRCKNCSGRCSKTIRNYTKEEREKILKPA